MDNNNTAISGSINRPPAPSAPSKCSSAPASEQRHLGADARPGQHARVRAREHTKAPEGAATGAAPAARSAARSACSRASAPWRSRASGRSSPRARSSARWPASAPAARSAASSGALVGMGIPEYEAKRYEGRVKDGGVLLSVHADDLGAGQRAPRRSSRAPAPRTSRRRARRTPRSRPRRHAPRRASRPAGLTSRPRSLLPGAAPMWRCRAFFRAGSTSVRGSGTRPRPRRPARSARAAPRSSSATPAGAAASRRG